MIDLNLEKDERVILDCEDITWVSDNNRKIRTLVLTDKGLYCVYQVKESFFSRPVDEIYRFELQDIVVEEEFARIRQMKIRNERCLEIHFKHGMEYFSFQRQSKQVLNNWCAAICSVLGVRNPADYQKDRTREVLTTIADQMVDGVATVLGTSSDVLFGKLEKIKERTADVMRSQGSAGRGPESETRERSSAGSRTVPPTGKGAADSRASAGNASAAASSWSLGKTGSFSGSWSDPAAEGSAEPDKEAESGNITRGVSAESDGSMPSAQPAAPPPLSGKEGQPAQEKKQDYSYFVAIGGQARGPFDEGALKQFAASGQIRRETLAWKQGMENWKPIQDIEELKDLTDSIPPSLN